MADSYLNKSGLSYFWDKINNKKQNKLTPGSNITISGDTISASQPTVNNGKLTIQKNGTDVQTFTANQSSNATANITVPTKTSDITNDSGFVTGSITKANSGTLGTTTINSTTASYMEVRKLTTATDINTLQTTGIYIVGASGCTNTPTGAWGTIYVDWTIGTKYQLYISDGATTTIYKRGYSGGAWGAWQVVNPTYSTMSVSEGTTGTATTARTVRADYLKQIIQHYNPTKTSDLTNDGSDGTSTYVEADQLATVATSGSYNDLSNKPTIPTVNNATLTIQKNGANVQTFTANSSTNKTANITVPTKVSDLTNTSGGFITYCTCTSAAADTTKVITVDSGDSNWALRKGTVIAVRFTNTNTASNVKFNVGGSGAKSVYYNTGVNTGSSNTIFGYANRVVFYLYDGTNWVWISDSRHDGNDNTYTTAYCSTAAGTAAKTASMTGYVLTANRYTVLTITNANTAASALTLNINGKGAKPLYINGTASSSTNHTLPAGSYIVWYDGTNYYIYNNGEIPRMIHSEEPVSVTPPSASVSGSEITDGSITYAKTATGEFLKLQLSTVDIGEGVSLPPNTLYGVYE